MLKNLALVLAGVVGATTFVIACSDDSPGDADAAVCDCDPAEAPLAGRIIRVENRTTASTPGIGAVAGCAAGATLLGGGCYTEGLNARTPRLIQSGNTLAGPTAFGCDWDNAPQAEVTGVAWATCLNPAQ
jgi:hypothetical protein